MRPSRLPCTHLFIPGYGLNFGYITMDMQERPKGASFRVLCVCTGSGQRGRVLCPCSHGGEGLRALGTWLPSCNSPDTSLQNLRPSKSIGRKTLPSNPVPSKGEAAGGAQGD